MFHFPTFPPTALYIQAEVTGHDSSRVSPFGHPWITARLPAPQGFSQAPTSFIGFWCQGIHRVPLLTWPHKLDARVHCAVLKLRAGSLVGCGACRALPAVHPRTRPRPKRPSARSDRASVSKDRLPVPSGPNSVSGASGRRRRSTPRGVVLADVARATPQSMFHP